MKHVNLYLDPGILEALEARSDGHRQGWNRSSVARAMLRLYLGIAQRAQPELPARAWPVLCRLLAQPETYRPQTLDLLAQMVETHPDLERVCAEHRVDAAALCAALARLDVLGVVALLDRLLLGGSP